METINLTSAFENGKSFIGNVEAKSGVKVKACYQCGKCSAGCPVAFAMDYTPRQIIRLVQLGLKEEVLKCKTIWLCAHCETCYTRCPKEIELAKLMETLRMEAKAAGYVQEKNIDLFSDLFLKSVENHGRVHELGLVIGFNLFSMQPLKDAGLGPIMLQKGKIHILPENVKNKAAIKRIFERSRQLGGEAK
ncbi:MAG: 4Fe-4S dicluster domain-containing protein [Bacillota bacterium]|nr:4Fe-4S dicluster domain-containing protein [Bacillota bacterium]